MGLIDSKVGQFSIGEAFAIGITKSLSENFLSKFIGNGTYYSGAIKIAGAWGLPILSRKVGLMKNSGKITKIMATAVVVDGVEDMVNNLFKGGAVTQESSGMLI